MPNTRLQPSAMINPIFSYSPAQPGWHSYHDTPNTQLQLSHSTATPGPALEAAAQQHQHSNISACPQCLSSAPTLSANRSQPQLQEFPPPHFLHIPDFTPHHLPSKPHNPRRQVDPKLASDKRPWGDTVYSKPFPSYSFCEPENGLVALGGVLL